LENIQQKHIPSIVKTNFTEEAYNPSYENLNSVQIDTPSNNFVSRKSYYIQVGAYTNSADKLIEKLDYQELNYSTKEQYVKGKRFNLLLVGRYSSRKEASRDFYKAKKVTNNALKKHHEIFIKLKKLQTMHL
jgi:cell division protein FtsN